MRRQIGRTVLCAGLLLGGAWQAKAQQPPPTPQNQPPQRLMWWRSDIYQKNLLDSELARTRLEVIFQAALPDLRKGRDERMHPTVRPLRLGVNGVGEAQVIKQLDKVE